MPRHSFLFLVKRTVKGKKWKELSNNSLTYLREKIRNLKFLNFWPKLLSYRVNIYKIFNNNNNNNTLSENILYWIEAQAQIPTQAQSLYPDSTTNHNSRPSLKPSVLPQTLQFELYFIYSTLTFHLQYIPY